MPWFHVDDGFHTHPKVAQITHGTTRDAAVALWVRGGSWCARHQTDGFIPAGIVKDLGYKLRSAEWLVITRLWHDEGHDCETCPPVPAAYYLYHDWPACNPTRDQLDERRRQASARQAKWRSNRSE